MREAKWAKSAGRRSRKWLNRWKNRRMTSYLKWRFRRFGRALVVDVDATYRSIHTLASKRNQTAREQARSGLWWGLAPDQHALPWDVVHRGASTNTTHRSGTRVCRGMKTVVVPNWAKPTPQHVASRATSQTGIRTISTAVSTHRFERIAGFATIREDSVTLGPP